MVSAHDVCHQDLFSQILLYFGTENSWKWLKERNNTRAYHKYSLVKGKVKWDFLILYFHIFSLSIIQIHRLGPLFWSLADFDECRIFPPKSSWVSDGFNFARTFFQIFLGPLKLTRIYYRIIKNCDAVGKYFSNFCECKVMFKSFYC